jgi:hypothetical protein
VNIPQHQAENARKRLLFGMSRIKQGNVALWSIKTSILAYSLQTTVDLMDEAVLDAAHIRTRLNPLAPVEITFLVKCGCLDDDGSLPALDPAANSPVAGFVHLRFEKLAHDA